MKPYDNRIQGGQPDNTPNSNPNRRGLINRHPIVANIIIILIVAALGLVIAYLSLNLFTKHNQTDTVPRVVNMTYSSAIEKLHEHGFKVEIKDSVYFDDVKPGIVVDQFPASGAVVKPGRKVFLYINAVHPKEVIIDGSGNTRQPALRGLSMRQAKAQLQELGFKNVKVEYVLGDTDRVLRITANGKIVRKLEKVPISAKIILYVYDGRKSAIADSLFRADGSAEIAEQTQYETQETYPVYDPETEFEYETETNEPINTELYTNEQQPEEYE